MDKDKLLKLLVKFLAISMNKSASEVNAQLTMIGPGGDLLSRQISMQDLSFAVEGVEAELNIEVMAASYPNGRVTLKRILMLLEDAWAKKYGRNSVSGVFHQVAANAEERRAMVVEQGIE